MKNIFKYMIPCLAVAFGLTSCNSTMDDKAAIDAMYQKATTAVVTMGNTNADDYQTITVDGAVTNEAEVIEVGFQVSKASDFSAGATYYHVDEVVSNFSYTIAGLAEKTTYYVRAYAATRTAGIIFSESKTVTTPAAPIFPLDGVYTATEIDEPDDWMVLEKLMRKYKSEFVIQGKPNIKLFITDIDGTLTDGGMYYSENGDELKKFNTRDGMGLQMLRDAGIKTAIITSEDRQLNQRRAEKLRVDYIRQGKINGFPCKKLLI